MNINSHKGNDLKYTNSTKLCCKDTDEDDENDQDSTILSELEKLLNATSLCNIIQSHTKILVLDSRLPLSICFRSLSNYHQDFAFVYDSENMCITGYLDEHSVVKFLRNFESFVDFNCSKFLNAVNPEPILKLLDDSTAYQAFELITKNMLNRLFLWSRDRKAPIGYFTPFCFLSHVVKNIKGLHEVLDLPLHSLPVDRNFTKLSSNTRLLEALDFLVLKDNIALLNSKGNIIGILTRRKMTFYFLDLLTKEIQLVYTIPVIKIVNEMDLIFRRQVQSLRVDSTTPIRDAISSVLLSNDGVLVYTDKNGSDMIVTIWDLIRFLNMN